MLAMPLCIARATGFKRMTPNSCRLHAAEFLLHSRCMQSLLHHPEGRDDVSSAEVNRLCHSLTAAAETGKSKPKMAKEDLLAWKFKPAT